MMNKYRVLVLGGLVGFWRGPFYIGKLQSPISLGDLLAKIFETVWQIVLLFVTAVFVYASYQFVAEKFKPKFDLASATPIENPYAKYLPPTEDPYAAFASPVEVPQAGSGSPQGFPNAGSPVAANQKQTTPSTKSQPSTEDTHGPWEDYQPDRLVLGSTSAPVHPNSGVPFTEAQKQAISRARSRLALVQFLSDPVYKNLSATTKLAIFNETVVKDAAYINANNATKAEIRKKYTSN